MAAGVLSIGVFVLLYLRRRSKAAGKFNEQSAICKEFAFNKSGEKALLITSDGKKNKILHTIETRTKTVINFKTDPFKYTIEGFSSDIELANQLLELELSKPVIITEELEVSSSSCGKIEGYSGSVLLEICSKSSAKVWVDPSSRKPYSETRKVLITGTREQVEFAKELINEKISESHKASDEGDGSTESTTELKKPNSHNSAQTKITSVEQREIFLPTFAKLEAIDGKCDFEVFVSAAQSPSQIYVQRADSQSTELDYLVDTMTQYYSSKENRELNTIKELYLGQICAAMLLTDNKW